VQAICAAELAFGSGAAEVLPACADGVAPCWEVQQDLQNCPYDSGNTFIVRRALVDDIPFETMLRADCLVDWQ
jgi:hypothetical protein